MFIHTITHTHTPLDDGDPDEYGQPTSGTSVETTVRGLVQPRSVREMADSRSAGSEVADHVIFLPRMALDPADSLTYAGELYLITGIRDFDFGALPHVEVDARRVAPAAVTAAGS